jgi:hypothetical protein
MVVSLDRKQHTFKFPSFPRKRTLAIYIYLLIIILSNIDLGRSGSARQREACQHIINLVDNHIRWYFCTFGSQLWDNWGHVYHAYYLWAILIPACNIHARLWSRELLPSSFSKIILVNLAIQYDYRPFRKWDASDIIMLNELVGHFCFQYCYNRYGKWACGS